MKAGAIATAPSWHGAARWRVEVLGRRPKGGLVRVRWLEGPLAGKEATLAGATLQGVG